MSKKLIEKFYSDLSGNEITSDSATVEFAFDGTSYEIDLTPAEKEKFRKAISTYIDAGRRVTAPRSRRPSSRSTRDPKAIRAWAIANNVDMPARGRIPQTVIEAYEAAN